MDQAKVECIGFIMDGNRRWAKKHRLPSLEGHQKGFAVFEESIQWVHKAGIPHAVYYAFSTENWRRATEEVMYLMDLFESTLSSLEKRLKDRSLPIAFRVIGRVTDFDQRLQERIKTLEAASQETAVATTIWIALSYGGRAEIVEAVNEVVKRGEVVTEESFAQLLWSKDLPDPDLIVRTGGEQRLSNFMTWQSVYSELLFLNKHWPALTEVDFKEILCEYESRERRRGK